MVRITNHKLFFAICAGTNCTITKPITDWYLLVAARANKAIGITFPTFTKVCFFHGIPTRNQRIPK